MRIFSNKKTYTKSRSKHFNAKSFQAKNFKQLSPAEKTIGVTLALMAAIVPLIVHYVELPTGPDLQTYINSQTTHIDMFSYYKSVCVLAAGAILACCLLYRLTKAKLDYKKILRHPFSIAISLFILTTIASSVRSFYKYTTLHGIYERYESVFILLCYLVIFASALIFTKSAFQLKILLWGLLFSCFIIGLIGTFQIFGMDIFMTDIGRYLVTGDSKRILTSQFTSTRTAYTTLYNPNSVGSYTAMLLPITVIGACVSFKNKPLFIAFISCAIVSLFTAIGCDSEGGLVGIAFSALLTAVILGIRLVKNKKVNKRTLGLFGIIIVVIAGLFFAIPPVRTRGVSMLNKIFLTLGAMENNFFFKDLYFNDEIASVITSKGGLHFIYEMDKKEVTVTDDLAVTIAPVSNEIDSATNDIILSYDAPGYGKFLVNITDNAFAFNMNDGMFMFTSDENGNIMPLSRTLQPIDPHYTPPSYGFKGYELWASSRGYIWSRTIPLLRKRLILGSGPDTFLIDFPQDDVSGKTQFLGNPYITVDKAHNLYLQTGVNTGLISMLALIFMFGWYITASALTLIKRPESNENAWLNNMNLAILAGISGYVVSVIATDSNVSVSPVFWMIFGIGFALLLQGGATADEQRTHR
ncbi:MAG: O-antigen ligase family protein [Clostridiales bacterium]|jgi:hypothetical protein|nr:O-antigen ligase family protein [Clostridiales bacterium]